jgi:hypothetical protein
MRFAEARDTQTDDTRATRRNTGAESAIELIGSCHVSESLPILTV